MLTAVGFPTGNDDGKASAASTQSIRDFQTSQPGLTVDGSAGPKTREKLFAAYFVFLGGPKLTKADFLGKGADAGGKADLQGCSEFNPVMMFSAAESTALESNKPERNKQNAINRRVLVLLFRPGSVIPPAGWPCPRFNEGPDGCKARFFSDAAKRRQFQAKRRTVEVDKDTFACRFYELILNGSPCEGPNPTPIILEEVNPLIVLLPPAPAAVPGGAAPPPGGSAPPVKASGSTPAPAGGSVSASTRVVFVKRPYTNPAGATIVLKTDAGFDGKGKLTIN
jgi:hypothetical protein